MANKYVLHGNGIQVDYTIGGNPGFTALTFTEGGTTKNFTPAQITTDQTGLGTLVSVALALTVDTGGTRFGFFLPDGAGGARTERAGDDDRRVRECSAVRTASRIVRRPGSACICTARRRR